MRDGTRRAIGNIRRGITGFSLNPDSLFMKRVESRVNSVLDEPVKKLSRAFSDVEKIISSGYGGVLDFSPAGTHAAENSIRETQNALRSLSAYGVNSAFDFYAKRYSMMFSNITDPQLSTAVSSIGGYYEVLAQGLLEQERLSQQYREMGLQNLQNVSNILIGEVLSRSFIGSAGRTLLRSSSRAVAARVLRSARGTILRGAARSFARRLAAAGTGALINPGVGLAIAAGMAMWEGWNVIRNISRSKSLTEMAQNKALISFFNPKALMSVYQSNAALLGEDLTRFGRTGGLDLLVGTGFEDQQAYINGDRDTPPTQGMNSWSSRVYNSAFTGSYSSISSGLDLRSFGVDTERILATASGLSRSIQTGANSDIVASILSTSSLYSGADPSLMQEIMKNIIRSNAYTEQDVTEATQRFEEFFAVVVGDGVPQQAHLNLVSALSSFSYEYALGTRANLGATTEIAKVQQFMGDNGMINGRFDTSATQSVITSLDDFLLRGSTFQDLNAAQVVSSMGISREDAIRGITYDASTFDRALSGIISSMGVSYSDILSDTPKFNIALQNLSRAGNFSKETMNPLMVAIKRYAQGNRVEDIRQEYMRNLESKMDERVSSMGTFADAYANVFEVNSLIVSSQNKLLDTVNLNLDVISSLNDILVTITERGFAGVSEGYLSTIEAFFGVFEAPTGGRSLSYRLPVPQSTQEEIDRIREGVIPQSSATGIRAARNREAAATRRSAEVATEREAAAARIITQSSGDLDDRFFKEEFVSSQARDVLSSIFGYASGGENFKVTSIFGSYPDNSGQHFGFDFVISGNGTITFPFKEGEVVYLGVRGSSESVGGYGNSIAIKLPNNYIVSFSHLQSLPELSIGTAVGFGDVVGIQGSTGRSSGPHVDMEIRKPGASISSNRIIGGHIQSIDDVLELKDQIPGYANGGIAFPDKSPSRPSPSTETGRVKNMYITIPISSKNPALTASTFKSSMRSILG